MFKILLVRDAEKGLAKLPKLNRERIAVALDELCKFGPQTVGIKKLNTPFIGYRKRVGGYRILFEVNEDVIIVYKISKRADVYR